MSSIYLPLTNSYVGGCNITLQSFVGPTGPSGPTGATGPIGPTGPYNLNTYSTSYILDRVNTSSATVPNGHVSCNNTNFEFCSFLYPSQYSTQGIDFWQQSLISTWRTGDKISIQKTYDGSKVLNYTLTGDAFYSFGFQVPVVTDFYNGTINNNDDIIFTYIPQTRDGATGQ